MATKAEIQATAYRAEASSERTEAVTERRPVDAGGGGNVTVLRTELVTLEIKHFDDNDGDSVYRWNWAEMMAEQGLGINESVRVVDEPERLEARVSVLQAAVESARDERDAAIRERDRLAGKIVVMEGSARIDMETQIAVEEAWQRCDIPIHWPSDEPETAMKCAESMEREIVRLRARVAELEAIQSFMKSPAESCKEERDAGNGGCGACSICCEELRQKLESVESAPAASGAAGTGWLTAEEREALRWVGSITPISEDESRRHFSAIRGLLSRS